jgi:cytoskeletal protein RodZ
MQALEQDAAPGKGAETTPSPVDQTSIPSTNSDAIFIELGHTLQAQRELMGLSLGDVERHTHIRLHYIRALEQGDISHLPSPVQGRGMLSNYATFLGLNNETVLLRFADGLQASLYDRQAARDTSPTNPGEKDGSHMPARPSQLKRLFSMDLFVGGFLIIFLLGFSIWGALRISRLHSAAAPSPTAPPVSEILLSTDTQGLASAVTPNPSTEVALPPGASLAAPIITTTLQVGASPTQAVFVTTPGLQNAPIQVYVVGIQRAWMRITVDGEVAFEGRVIPGSAYSFSGNERIELLTGDAAGLQVVFNQQDLGILGGFGEVVERVFSIEGVQTATPSVLPTSTPLLTSAATPSPSPTPTALPLTPTQTPKP